MRQPGGVELSRARRVVLGVVALGPAGQEVHLRLGGRDGHVGVALRGDDLRLLVELDPLGWPVWNHGPNAHGVGGGGWRPWPREPPQGVGRRRARKDPQRGRAPSTSRLQASGRRCQPKRLVSSLSISTP